MNKKAFLYLLIFILIVGVGTQFFPHQSSRFTKLVPTLPDKKIKIHSDQIATLPSGTRTPAAQSSNVLSQGMERSDWQSKLIEELKQGLPLGSKVSFKHIKTQKIRSSSGLILREIVAVTKTTSDGGFGSYTASVDPKTGKVLKTWSTTHIEMSSPIRLVPSGGLY